MSKDHFVLTGVQATPDYRLHLHYADGAVWQVDLRERIHALAYLAPLQDTRLFCQATLGFAGRCVEWISDELDLAADNLRHLAVEQAGGIGHERLWRWLHASGLSLEQAAQALGISRRMLIYYRDGEKPIPRSIWLACLGWEAIRPQGNVLPEHIPSVQEYATLHAS